MPDELRFGISDASDRVPCTVDALRRLDSKGIIHPSRDRLARRLFTQHDIEEARAHLARRGKLGEH